MGGGPPNAYEWHLADVLTPHLLALLVKDRLPYDESLPINFSHFGRDIFLTDPFGPLVREKVWPVLISLSKIGLEKMPDLTTFLPSPLDPEYPIQCLGLLLLLDHCPRLLFRGIDHRWTYAYFSELSQRVAESWYSLPRGLRPDTWERWHDDLGAELDYWIGVRFWFGTPFVHSERLEHQEVAIKFTEETRTKVEEVTGQTDPYRAQRKEVLSDLYGFPREYVRGPPQGGGVTREAWTFWMGMLMDIHKPIIDRFGRYPYLNAICGREWNGEEEEEEWVKAVHHFGVADEDVARRVKEDVKLGRWTPLGRDSLTVHGLGAFS
ncbi:hypothetical protein QBC43DRAFT_307045 [Cladorrhinum sp. PSN259]|nr:hypothetical protein QBC43DRAFT_307045 [Cladorrhinum sp. PSN259]